MEQLKYLPRRRRRTVIDPKDYNTSEELCPKCGAQLQGEPIPKEDQHLFCATHFSRKIGIYSLEEDRTIRYKCPFCNEEWGRNC